MVENQLLVRKIENGIVIDHISAGEALSVLKILRTDPHIKMVIASNVDSSKYGKKDIVKLEGKYLTSKEIDLISLVAPTATINQIENWELKEKQQVKFPETIEGIFKCRNPACITNDGYGETKTKFSIIRSDDVKKTIFKCSYCDSALYYNEAIEFLKTNPAVIGGLVSRKTIEKTFLDVLIGKGALRIAPNVNELFVFKSGRKSPNFINMGALTDGESLAKTKWAFASYIALLLEEKKLEDFDFIFGPAYKGINLAVLACEGLNELFGMKKRYLYDRKEEKTYADKKMDQIIVGSGYFKPGQKILIVDDVITTGGTKVEALEKLELLGDHKVVGLVLAVDRQERMGDAENVEEKSAIQYIEDEFGVSVFPILGMESIFNLVKGNLSEEIKQNWIDYYKRYGVVQLS
jgi:aspartate carbamoyltransferase regulatory subunit